MFAININIIIIVLMTSFVQIHSLVELPPGGNGSLKNAETTILKAITELFTDVKVPDVKQKADLQQYYTINDYFISLVLTDFENVKKVVELLRVNDTDNKIQPLIAKVNEVLREIDKTGEVKSNDVLVTKYIELFITKLKYMKENYDSHKKTVINDVLSNYLNKTETKSLNIPGHKNNNKIQEGIEEEIDYDVSSESEFWKPSGRRVYKGLRTRIKKFPFIASVQFFKKFQCVGSIIKNDLVITSASCLQLMWNNRFFRENPAILSVQVGSDFYEHGGENIRVLEIYFHPSYSPKTVTNNLAIIRLVKQLVLKNKHMRVKKIEIDRSPFPLPSTTNEILVVGWGAKDSSNIIYNILENKLSYAKLDYFPLVECQEIYSRDYVSLKNFCAGFMSKGGGACTHDVGGPAVIDGTLIGVISFGSPICGASDSPTVFTKLGFYADWIDGIMNQEVPKIFKRTTTKSPDRKIFLEVINKIETMKLTPITPEKVSEYKNKTAEIHDFDLILNKENSEVPFELSKEITKGPEVTNTTVTTFTLDDLDNTTFLSTLMQPQSDDVKSTGVSSEDVTKIFKVNTEHDLETTTLKSLDKVYDQEVVITNIKNLIDDLDIDKLFIDKCDSCTTEKSTAEEIIEL